MATERNIGKIVQVIGPTVDVEFPSDSLPPILNAIRIKDEDAPHRHHRGGLAPRGRQCRALHRDELDGRARARHARRGSRRPDHRARGNAVARPDLQPARRTDRRKGAASPIPNKRYPIHRTRTQASRTRRPRPPSSRRASRSSTSSPRTPRGARSACSAAPASARRSSSRSSSATSPPSTADTPCSPAWAREPARATTSTSK